MFLKNGAPNLDDGKMLGGKRENIEIRCCLALAANVAKSLGHNLAGPIYGRRGSDGGGMSCREGAVEASDRGQGGSGHARESSGSSRADAGPKDSSGSWQHGEIVSAADWGRGRRNRRDAEVVVVKVEALVTRWGKE